MDYDTLETMLFFNAKEGKPRWLWPLGACLGVTILGYIVPLLHWNMDAGKDWDLFSAYSLILRSNLLRFHQLSLHDPFVWGGIDLFGNPQTRQFSPSVLLDILFPPYVNDLFALMIYGFVGMLGMIAVLRDLGRSRAAAFGGAVLFIQSSWFGLHYVEGHMAYGAMQLLPWVYYFGRKLEQPSAFFGLVSLFALFILDGAIYPAIFSALLIIACAGAGLIDPWAPFRGGREGRVLNLLAVVAAALLVSTKVVPLLLLNSRIRPRIDFTDLHMADLARVLFNPFQRSLDIASTESLWRFHEFGCYLSPLALFLILFRLREKPFLKENLAFLVLFLLFFWMGSGLGGYFNPWSLYQHIPLFNVAHVQSRLFVVMDFFFALLAAAAVDTFRGRRRLFGILLAFLVVEALFVKIYPFVYGYRFDKPRPEVTLIPRASVQSVKGDGVKPELYFKGDACYLHAYEAAFPETQVLSEESPGYRGLIYTLRGPGQMKIESYTPGRIELSYVADGPTQAEIDTNYLGGWISEAAAVEVHRGENGLIDLGFGPGKGRTVVLYRPTYLKFVLPAYVLGLFLWIALVLRLRGRNRRTA